MSFRTGSDLAALGFGGFLTFDQVLDAPEMVPAGAGVYAVVAKDGFEPVFARNSRAGRFKGKNPTVEVETLARNWVKEARILYFGKASSEKAGKRGLRTRLAEYARFGRGEPIGHWGGRFVWQVIGYDAFHVSWLETDADTGSHERDLICAFRREHGRLPFANLRT